jgi:hypothetical protein
VTEREAPWQRRANGVEEHDEDGEVAPAHGAAKTGSHPGAWGQDPAGNVLALQRGG